jgi:hypothetical protein
MKTLFPITKCYDLIKNLPFAAWPAQIIVFMIPPGASEK